MGYVWWHPGVVLLCYCATKAAPRSMELLLLLLLLLLLS